jgi:hypothetical protein
MNEIPENKHTKYQFNAFLGHYLIFGNYLGSYKRAFEVLMESLILSRTNISLRNVSSKNGTHVELWCRFFSLSN